MAIYKEDLDQMQCAFPGCTHEHHTSVFYWHGACHMNSPAWASYDRSTGILTVECAECNRVIGRVHIASKEPAHAQEHP